MVRLAVFLPLILLFCPQPSQAETPDATDPRISSALAVQDAMARAREHLQAKRPGEAVGVLEAQILSVNGNASFLALMKEAYIAQFKDLKRRNGDPERLDHVRRQLRTLDPKLNPDDIDVAGPVQENPGVVQAPALIEAPSPMQALAPIGKPSPVVVQAKSTVEDPFQQTPLDRMAAPAATGNAKALARAQFEQKRYAEAAGLFAQALKSGAELTDEEKQAWGYSRLSVVVKRLANSTLAKNALPGLESETEEAIKLGGSSLEKFGQQVLAEIRRRQGKGELSSAPAVPAGWQALETANFRVFFQQSRPQAEQIAKSAEQIRTAAYETWVGPAGSSWAPRCDLWLHPTGEAYAKETAKPTASPGHASVGIKDGKIMARRLDLRLDDDALAEATLPREVNYIVVSDLFAEQPLPRWADVGMTILAESPQEVSRYRRAAAKLTTQKKFFALRELLKMSEFPEAERITPFYVESVSLVEYLVRLKGAKAFALYLREAPRRGYEEALERHYGIKDASDLQERWLKFAMTGE